MGPGLLGVRYLCGGAQDRLELVWPGGRAAYLAVGPAETWLPFHATVVTKRNAFPLTIDSSKLYEALLDTVLPRLTGQIPATLPLRTWLEPELAALAGLKSRQQGGGLVGLDDLTENDPSFDGATFATEYRRKVHP